MEDFADGCLAGGLSVEQLALGPGFDPLPLAGVRLMHYSTENLGSSRLSVLKRDFFVFKYSNNQPKKKNHPKSPKPKNSQNKSLVI